MCQKRRLNNHARQCPSNRCRLLQGQLLQPHRTINQYRNQHCQRVALHLWQYGPLVATKTTQVLRMMASRPLPSIQVRRLTPFAEYGGRHAASLKTTAAGSQTLIQPHMWRNSAQPLSQKLIKVCVSCRAEQIRYVYHVPHILQRSPQLLHTMVGAIVHQLQCLCYPACT